MTENHPSFPGREGIPASLHQHIPEGWQPSPMPEDCQLPPATYATAEAYARFIAPGLHRPFMQMLGVGEAAIYDADQEVAMTLLENFRRRPLPDDISRKWLAAQVRNKAVDAIRATEREMGLIDWQDDDKEWFSNPVYDPETAVLSRLTIEEVDTLLDKLPATQAEILRLTFSDSSLRAQDIGELV